jgi:FkbM family methyltransferase
MSIKNKFKKIIHALTAKYGLKIVDLSTLKELEKNIDSWQEKVILEKLFDGKNGNNLLSLIAKSSAQLKQDLFVISHLGFKDKGFFVEFGATDGKILSNTLMLERYFDWTGILAEPAVYWHQKLKENRNCIIDKSCIWKESDLMIKFKQVEEKEFSTISHYTAKDSNSRNRVNGSEYLVRTKTLRDLLISNKAPKIIDYLSIDTEGSEFEIINAFNFNEFNFRVITCEHNYTKNRDLIYKLLCSNGYKRVYEEISQFDDWYININF